MNKEYSLIRPPKDTPKLYETESMGNVYDCLVFAHYFIGDADWFVLEYSPEEDLIFCWCEILPDCGELGYTSLKELDQVFLANLGASNSRFQNFPLKVSFVTNWKRQSLHTAISNR